jgi:sporulation protein YlmC with PRC-barrel domain
MPASMRALLMRARYAVLSLTLLIAGCSACAELRPLKAIKTLDGRQKVATVKEAAATIPEAGQDSQYRLSDLLNKTVRDKTGKEVARVGDVAIDAHGQIVSVTLILAGGTGAKINVPFERLKVTGHGGALYLQTDVVAGTAEGPPSKTAQEVQGQKTGAGAPHDPESKPK